MLFSSFKNLVGFFRQSNRGLTKLNISNQFCKPVVGLCALLCMSLWISAAQAQTPPPDQMRTSLAFGGLIPAAYTYTDTNSAEITETAENDPNIDDVATAPFNGRTNGSGVGVVDWVEVQIRVVANTVTAPPTLRSNADSLYIKPAWLLSDGSVVNVDSDIAAINAGTNNPELTIPTGDGGLEFDATTQNLYVLVNHRNHLPIMSAAAVPASTEAEDAGAYVHDFIMEADQAFPGTAKLYTVNDTYVMYAGDSSGDEGITNIDSDNATRGSADNGQFNQSGYLESDYTLSGSVANADGDIASRGSADNGNFNITSPITY